MSVHDPNTASAPDSGIFGLDASVGASAIVLIPVPFDATASYGRGSSGGPSAILRASRQVDLFDLETGRPYQRGIVMLGESRRVRAWNRAAGAAARPVIRAGGAAASDRRLWRAAGRVNRLCERLNDWVWRQSRRHLDAGKVVGVVGGDHSTPFGAIRAYAERFPGMGVLQVDAHADLRPAFEGFRWSHASIMYNVLCEIPGVSKLVQVGIRDFCEQEHDEMKRWGGRVKVFFDVEIARARLEGRSLLSVWNRAVRALPREVYVSFDIDGLDPSLCPHTGTPVPGGLLFHEACALLRRLVESGRRVVGFDLNEVASGPRGDEWDANVGARLLYKLVGWTLVSGSKGGRPI
jgi:agmatinase